MNVSEVKTAYADWQRSKEHERERSWVFADAVLAYTEEHGRGSQKALAKALGMSEDYLSNVKRAAAKTDVHNVSLTTAIEAMNAGVTPEEGMTSNDLRNPHQSPTKIVEAITKASPSDRKKIMRGIAEEPVLHGEAGSAIVEVAQEWEKDGWDEYKKTSPEAYNFGRWGTAHTHLMHARDRLKLALEELREADISDDEHEGARKRLMKKATECDLLLDWIKSNLESGNRDFDTELGALLAGSEDDE